MRAAGKTRWEQRANAIGLAHNAIRCEFPDTDDWDIRMLATHYHDGYKLDGDAHKVHARLRRHVLDVQRLTFMLEARKRAEHDRCSP
jgi:hypothetical protein